MIKRTPIIAGVTDPVKKAAELLNESKGDITKRAAAFSQIAEFLAAEKKAAQAVYLDEICQANGLKKTELRAAIRAIEAKKKKAEKEQKQAEAEKVTRLDRYEMFLTQHFNIRYNEILMEYEITDKNDPEAENIDEYAILRAMRKANFDISERNLIEILKSPYVFRYNPIRDYFKNLKDYKTDEPDYIAKLAGYLNVEDFDIFKKHFKKHLVRVVAGALEKDFNKQVFTLVGDGIDNQNSGKSTFIRWLVPPALDEYYMEDLPQDKDGLIALTDNIIINLDELESLARYEINKLKSVLSKDTIKVRPPYGRRAIAIPRRASFFASTNEISFLSDLTGNVRWVVFKLKDIPRPINWDYMQDIDINDIWRQAYYLFRNGFDYKLTREEIEENERRNFDFLTLPPEYDLITQMFLPGKPEDHDDFFTTTDFMNALHGRAGGSIKLNIIRLGKTLRKLGFKQMSKRTDEKDYSVKGYYVKFKPGYRPPQTDIWQSENREPAPPATRATQTEMKLREKQFEETPF